MPVTPGGRFGGYDVIAAIGRGGMGEVFRARDVKLGRDVALKVLPAHIAAEPERRQRFEREARILASLNHPHIAAIHGYEAVDGVQGLILELVEGPTLADRIGRGPIPIAEALDIAAQIADALEAAHNAGVIHRDLKPANVKVTPERSVKVLDFGLAKAFETGDVSPLLDSPTITNHETQPGVILGTAAYMSPEQARGGAVDKRADVWAFGCLLYEMLAGTRAFGGDHVTDVIVSVMREEPKWTLLPAATPPAVRRLLARCLVKDPRSRLRDLGDAQLDLREALTAPPGGDAAANDDGRPARRVVPWLTAIVMTSLVTGVGVWGVMRAAPLSTAPAERIAITLPATAPLVGIDQAAAELKTRAGLAISPDGRTIVYAGPAENRRSTRLYVRSLDAYEPRPLVGTDGASAPFFSPDGQAVAFFAAGKLLRASISGGGVATICDAPEDTGGIGGTWGPDDAIVFAAPTSARAGLRLVSAYGGVPKALTTPDPADEGGHGDPSFIPGTRAVLFTTRLTRAGVPSAVMVHSLTTGQHHKLTDSDILANDPQFMRNAASPTISRPVYTSTGYVVFRRGLTIMAVPFRPETLQMTGPAMTIVEQAAEFDMSAGGRLAYMTTPSYGGQLVWVDRETGAAEPISGPDQRFGRPRLSPDGKQIVAEVLRGDRSDIGVYQLSSRTLTLLTNDGASNTPNWHPDGRRIVFRAQGGLFLQPADGRTPAEIFLAPSDPALRSTSSLAPGVFTPDGSAYLFVVHGSAATSADIFTMRLGSNRGIEPRVQRPGNQWAVRVSPDGKWISYASDESTRFQVYIEGWVGGEGKHQVSSDGGAEAMWSSSGRELFYRSGDRMMVVPITTSPDSPVGGAPQVLFTGRYQSTDIPHYDVTHDGRRFLMVRPIADDADSRTIRIVDGWAGELKRRGSVSR